MGRWTQYDEDSYRLPSDLVRVGYDADTGQYTFRDRNGTYFNGVPGSQYGPMFPVGSSGRVPTPQLVDELVLSPQKDKPRRHATIAAVPKALRSLRRSLTTTVRKPWRRDQSSGSDEEEPVLVSRPSSPLHSEDSAVVQPVIQEARPPKPRSPSPAPLSRSKSSRNAPTMRKSTSSTSSSPPTPPPKDNPVPLTPKTSPRSSALGSKVASVAHSRSASTSAARTPAVAPQGRSRRAASEHIHSTARDPIATRSIGTADTSSKPASPAAPPVLEPVLPQKVLSSRNRRHASEQTPSSSASARSTSTSMTASPRPRTSAPLTRSVSTSLPRPSRTMTTELAKD